MGFECYRIGDLILDAGKQEVTRNGSVVSVPRLSYRLLLSLARHAPNVVNTQQLEKEVWEGLVVDRGTVNKRVLLLRKALRESEHEEPYIAVVRGSGYRLVSRVERINCTGDEVDRDEISPQIKLAWYKRSADTIRTVSFWLLSMVAVMALYNGFREPSIDAVTPGIGINPLAKNRAVATTYSQKSIAVMPFVDLSDNHAHDYLGQSIAEDVINLLAKIDGLDVAARTSSFALREPSSTLVEVAAKLRVGTILEGSIRHSEDRIRVVAQLIDAGTGYHIWSQTYDRAFEDVFEVQDDIASNIAQTLKISLTESNQPDSGRSMTTDMEAFKLYVKGRDLLNDRILLRTNGLREALTYFNEAIARDSQFARAHAGVAMVNWLLTSYDTSLEREDYFENAEVSARFALEIDPGSIDALGALASVYSKRSDLEQAAKMFERIRALNGSNTDTVSWEATLHIRLGYFEELIDTLSGELERDPVNEHIAWVLADALIFSGRPARAVEILEGLRHFSHRDYYLALAAIYSEDYEKARGLLRGVRMRSGVLSAEFADLVIDALEGSANREDVAETLVLAAKNGELDKVVSFEALLILDSPSAFDLGIDPLEDIGNLQIHAQIWNNWAVGFRQDPRFKEWVTKLGYVDFWQKHKWPDRCRPTGLNDFECI